MLTTDLWPELSCMTWPQRAVKHVNMTHSAVCLFCPLWILSITRISGGKVGESSLFRWNSLNMQKGWWLMPDKLILLQDLFYEKPQMNLFSLLPKSGALYWRLAFTQGILRNPQMISLGFINVVICRCGRKEVNKNMIWHFISNARDGCAPSRGNEYCTCWSASNKGKCIACSDL